MKRLTGRPDQVIAIRPAQTRSLSTAMNAVSHVQLRVALHRTADTRRQHGHPRAATTPRPTTRPSSGAASASDLGQIADPSTVAACAAPPRKHRSLTLSRSSALVTVSSRQSTPSISI